MLVLHVLTPLKPGTSLSEREVWKLQSHISETKTCQCVLKDDNMSIAHSYMHRMISAHDGRPYQERQRGTSYYIFLIINKLKMLLQLINSVVRGN